MARPKSLEKQTAILQATSALIAQHGLTGSPTSLIAKKAGVSEGTIFHYFSNKDTLLNHLYLHINQELGQSLNQIQRQDHAFKDYLWLVWQAYIDWGTAHPEDSQSLSQLLNAGILLPETLEEVKTVLPQVDIGLTSSDERVFGEDNAFVEALFIAIASTTIDFCLSQPQYKENYLKQGFSLLWKIYEAEESPIKD